MAPTVQWKTLHWTVSHWKCCIVLSYIISYSSKFLWIHLGTSQCITFCYLIYPNFFSLHYPFLVLSGEKILFTGSEKWEVFQDPWWKCYFWYWLLLWLWQGLLKDPETPTRKLYWIILFLSQMKNDINLAPSQEKNYGVNLISGGKKNAPLDFSEI